MPILGDNPGAIACICARCGEQRGFPCRTKSGRLAKEAHKARWFYLVNYLRRLIDAIDGFEATTDDAPSGLGDIEYSLGCEIIDPFIGEAILTRLIAIGFVTDEDDPVLGHHISLTWLGRNVARDA